MVTYINKNTHGKYAGNSSEEKPLEVQNGSVFFEIDTGLYYMFDAENKVWYEQKDNGGGGGSGDASGSYFATCNDPASDPQASANTWYIPKSMPKPSVKVGMMVDVLWKNGRVDGLGYNVTLVWGEEGAVDNEVIVEQTSVVEDLTGIYTIPAEGTVEYQLVEQSGRQHWKFVSGDVIPKNFSSATEADVADKVVPDMAINYLPGMEIYIQLDKGNTAEVMNLVPAEGQSLPVYGNGVGAKTGAVPKGYILHLVNAGDHWQIVNKGPDVSYEAQKLTTGQQTQARKNINAQIAGNYATAQELADAIASLGTVFNYKGSQPTFSDLPMTSNKTGDVWYVVDESAGYIWLEEGRWEAFGPTIDLSGYLKKPETTGVLGDFAVNDGNDNIVWKTIELWKGGKY